MADDLERADQYTEFMKENTLSMLPKFDKASLTECMQCGDDIPLERQSLGSVTHCYDCANRLEKKGR